MSNRQQKDQQYRKKRKSLANYLQYNNKFTVAGYSPSGSRRQGDWDDESDQDIRITLNENSTQNSVYSYLKE